MQNRLAMPIPQVLNKTQCCELMPKHSDFAAAWGVGQAISACTQKSKSTSEVGAGISPMGIAKCSKAKNVCNAHPCVLIRIVLGSKQSNRQRTLQDSV
jgi:hypothetical protein